MVTVIVGRMGSGKTTLAKKMEELGWKRMVTYTSRPPREGEKFGEDYYFLSTKDFETLIDADYFAEVTMYQVTEDEGWYYGSAKHAYSDKDNVVVVLNPSGVYQLRKKGLNIRVIWLDPDSDLCLHRVIVRGDDKKEIARRFNEDDKDFEKFGKLEAYDIRVTYPWGANKIVDYLKEHSMI